MLEDQLKLLAGLANNAALLLSLVISYQLMISYFSRGTHKFKMLTGILFGGVCVVGMLLPVSLLPGVIFDARSVILTLAGLFGGPVAASISAIFAASYRGWLGGVGAVVGILVIATTALLGVFGYWLRNTKHWSLSAHSLLFYGVMVHALSFLWMGTLPEEIRWTVVEKMIFPFLVVLPLATLLLGKLMWVVEQRVEAERKLEISEQLYHSVVVDLPGLVCRNTPDGTIEYVNDRYSSYFGKSLKELVGSSFYDLLPEFDRDQVRQSLAVLTKDNPIIQHDHRVIDGEGNIRWQRWINRALCDDEGNVVMLQAFGTDITDKITAEIKIKKRDELLNEMGEIAKVGGWSFNPETGKGSWTAQVAKIHDMQPNEFTNLEVGLSFYKGNHRQRIDKAIHNAIERGESYDLELEMVTRKGNVKWVRTIGHPIQENNRTIEIHGAFQDISDMKQSEEKLDYLANYDSLTDLPNRTLLKQQLQHALRAADRKNSQVAVIYIDLDNFKNINDSFGHPVGDLVLKEVARYLRHTVRQGDSIARTGGDEFVILLEDFGQIENLGTLARKLMTAFGESIILEKQEINVTASIGICIYPRDGGDPDELLRNADSAMYRAKEEGRNTFQFYTEELTRKTFERVLLENSLRHAISNNELRVLYQPQVNLATNQFIGMEALVRWQHPELGMVSPAKFIPLAEESGIIHPLGEWVLREACLQGKKWLDRGIEFGRISVNVAGPQIQRGELPDIVKKILEETELPSRHLELEVTEGFIMQQAEMAITQLNLLINMGITLAIDDFGTGYSSLSYLKRLPVQKLKIDQSFVRDIPQNTDDVAIANAVVALGNSLGLTVIAEGVENTAQADFLKDINCEEGQGYLYSKPVDSMAIEKFIAKQAN